VNSLSCIWTYKLTPSTNSLSISTKILEVRIGQRDIRHKKSVATAGQGKSSVRKRVLLMSKAYVRSYKWISLRLITFSSYGKRQCKYRRDIQARPRNHCYRLKARSITCSECMSVALVNQHIKYMHRIVLSFVACLVLQYISTLTLRRLMSYIYGAPILDVSRPHTTTQHSR